MNKKIFEGKRNLRQSIAEEFHYLKTNSASSRKDCFQTERKKKLSTKKFHIWMQLIKNSKNKIVLILINDTFKYIYFLK